jgi:NADPH:quinone reductase-like Zn-dependent oxidoreductase
MKAIVMKEYGGAEAVEMRDIAVPDLYDRGVLIEVRAAALNPVDYKIRNGDLKRAFSPPLPFILGRDAAGVVKASGMRAWNFKTGDRVYASLPIEAQGCFAEYVLVDKTHLAEIPDSMSYEEAASLPVAALTAWQCLVDTMNVRPGQSILIHAGAGGVGSLAIQVAKHLGARVTATCGPQNVEFLRELGADEVVDYTKEDLAARDPVFDGVLDAIGGETTLASIRATKRGGYVVSIAGLPDPESARAMGMGWVARFALGRETRRAVQAAREAGVTWRFLGVHPSEAQLRQIAELVSKGTVRPVIDSTFAIEKFSQAFEKLETGHARGKIVLRVSEDPPEYADENDPRTPPGRGKKRRKRGPGTD